MGERRWGRPRVGDHINYHYLNGDPADLWARVIESNTDRFAVRMLDATRSWEWTEFPIPDGHCTVWEEPPDEFYVWQAAQALLSD